MWVIEARASEEAVFFPVAGTYKTQSTAHDDIAELRLINPGYEYRVAPWVVL